MNIVYIMSSSHPQYLISNYMYIQRRLQTPDVDAEITHSIVTDNSSAEPDSQPEPDSELDDEDISTQVREFYNLITI